MSYWSHHPEMYDHIIVKELTRRGLVHQEMLENESDYEIVHRFYQHPDFVDICTKAEQAYWGDRVDEAVNKVESDMDIKFFKTMFEIHKENG